MTGTRKPSGKATKSPARRVKRSKAAADKSPLVPVQVPVEAYSPPAELDRRQARKEADGWQVVGTNHLGQTLVIVPEWHACSVPRGVSGPHLLNDWQRSPSPPRTLTEPKCFPD